MTDNHASLDHSAAWKSRAIGAVCVIGAQFLFGTTFPGNKWILNQGIDPVGLGFARLLLAAMMIFPFFLARRHTTRWSAADWRRALLAGVCANGLAVILEYEGTGLTSASNASLIIATESVFSVFLAVWILKERLHYQTVAGGAAAMAGVALVMMRDVRHFEMHGGGGLLGDLMVLGSVVSWGFYTILSKRLLERSDPAVAIFYISIFACVPLGLVSAGNGALPRLASMNAKEWGMTIYLGAICSGLGFMLYFQGLKRLSASVVALTLTLIPVFGVLFSVLWLDERLGLEQLAGAVAILGGVTFAIWPREAREFVAEDIPPGQ
ncbi:MAG: EamA family transporter [bacterium]|nr:EamA family transporter [bacterium]